MLHMCVSVIWTFHNFTEFFLYEICLKFAIFQLNVSISICKYYIIICYLNFSQQYLYERFSQVCSLGNNRTPNELSSASTPSDFSQQRGAIVKFEIKLSFICCINGLHASCIIDPYHCANTGSLCWSADILPILLSYLPTSYTLKYWCHTILWVWMFVIVNWSPGYCTQTGIAFPVPLLYCVCVQSDVTTFPFSKSHKCSFSNACYLKSYGLKQIWTYWSNASFFCPFSGIQGIVLFLSWLKNPCWCGQFQKWSFNSISFPRVPPWLPGKTTIFRWTPEICGPSVHSMNVYILR